MTDTCRPLVSVVVPVYNLESYIGRCIESVMAQDYQNIELLLVDDGSSDSSVAVIERYMLSDSRIRLLRQPNSGVVKARETGVAMSSGEYLCFVDGDDYIPVDAISSMAFKAVAADADIVIGSYTLVWESDNGRRKTVANRKSFSTPAEAAVYCLQYGETFLPIKLIRRSKYVSSVKIPREIKLMEDTIGLLQLFSAVDNVSAVDNSVYYYCKREGSASFRPTVPKFDSLLKVASIVDNVCGAQLAQQLAPRLTALKIDNIYRTVSGNWKGYVEFCDIKNAFETIDPSRISGAAARIKYNVCRRFVRSDGKASAPDRIERITLKCINIIYRLKGKLLRK